MSRGIHAVLLQHYDSLNALYGSNLGAVRELQGTLILQILPGLVDEVELDEGDREYCLLWLRDTRASKSSALFHIFV